MAAVYKFRIAPEVDLRPRVIPASMFFDKTLLVHGLNYKNLGLVCQGNVDHKMWGAALRLRLAASILSVL
jgi:hypothetical protein